MSDTEPTRNVDGILDALGLRPRRLAAGHDWVLNWMSGGPFPPSGPGGFPETDAVERLVTIANGADAADSHEMYIALGGIANIGQGRDYLATKNESPWRPHEQEHIDRLTPAGREFVGIVMALVMLAGSRRAAHDMLADEMARRGMTVPGRVS